MDQGYRGAIRRSMEKPLHQSQHNSTPLVDYDDVFGGPPRLVASLLSSSSSSSPSSSLPPSSSLHPEKTILSKVPSFRTARVFELPVFGDDVMPASSPQPVYEDIFKENRQVSDAFAGYGSYGNPNSDINSRSRPNSRAGSRRMSPVHPSAPVAKNEPTDEEASYVKSSLASFLKSRSGGGRITSKSPFSSFSSVEESRAKGFDSPSLLSTRTPLTSPPVPPSPSEHPPTQFKRLSKSSSNHNRPLTSIEVDDVFGGFPQRSLLQQRSNNGRDAHRIKSEKNYPNAMFQGNTVVKTSDEYARKHRNLSHSFSSMEEQGLHEDFSKIKMDTDSESRGLQKTGKEWITVNDLRQSTKPSQPDNVSQLHFKSWKDWTSDLPSNLSTSSITGPLSDKIEGLWGSSRKSHDVDTKYSDNIVENLLSKQPSHRLMVKQYEDKFLMGLSPTSAEETVDMEERELQALLANAWKLNEEREKKEQSRILRERPKVVESKVPEMQPKKQKDSRQFKEARSQKSRMDRKNSEFPLTHSRHEKEGVKNAGTACNFATMESNSGDCKVPTQGTAQVFGKSDSVAENLFAVVSEEILTEASSGVAAEVVHDGRGKRQTAAVAEKTTDVQTSIKSDDVVNAGKYAELDPLQDIVQLNEEFDISPGEEIEDIECFLGLVSSLDGFQEIEGESLERRKSRLERHVRTKERAAKAVEEMQQREAESQREQEEKQQLAKISDQKIKRWAAGKEGNLRALLSNLQYVLWPDSGWTSLPLTSLIEGSDVKKAYRKATLFIHPDKLQQKSATLQQKYIAERVFDILQEAWKTFNMQELF